jgi:hypothetical protein
VRFLARLSSRPLRPLASQRVEKAGRTASVPSRSVLALALIAAASPSLAVPASREPISGAARLAAVPAVVEPAVRGPATVPSLTTVAAGVACSGGWLPPAPGESWATAPSAIATAPSDYYAIELVPTGRVPGTRLSKGVAYTTAATSPFFGVALAPSGEYVHDLDVRVEGLRPVDEGAYVVWVTDTDIAEVVRLGALDANLRLRGQARWNKFLVVLTREPTDEPTDAWQGPVIMRGMSRSGRMHTLAGHGPFQAEPCAKYGFR